MHNLHLNAQAMDEIKRKLDEQFNAHSPHLDPLVGRTQEETHYAKARDKHVALDRVPDVHAQENLVHFDISQAFAWDFLRKKQRATEEDLLYARELQEEMQAQLEREQQNRLQEQQRIASEDESLAKQLQEQLTTKENEAPQTNGLRDSALARLLQEEENSKVALHVSDSEFARRIMNEVLTIDASQPQLRQSTLDLIINQEFQGIRNSQRSLPQVLEQEKELRNSATLPAYMRAIPELMKLKVFPPLYAPEPLSPERLQSSIFLPNVDSMKSKFPQGSVVQIQSCDYPELRCNVTVGGHIAPPDSCFLSAADMTLLRVTTNNFIHVEMQKKAKAQSLIQVEFQPTNWNVMQGPNVRQFTTSLCNRNKEIQKGETIPFQNNGKTYEIVVKDCSPSSGVLDNTTTINFSSPSIPLAFVKEIRYNDPETIVCPADEYLFYSANIPQNDAWLENDLLIDMEVLAGNISLYADQRRHNPTAFDHEWSSTETLRITNTDPRVTFPVEKIYFGVRATSRDGAVTVSVKSVPSIGASIREVGLFNF